MTGGDEMRRNFKEKRERREKKGGSVCVGRSRNKNF